MLIEKKFKINNNLNNSRRKLIKNFLKTMALSYVQSSLLLIVIMLLF